MKPLSTDQCINIISLFTSLNSPPTLDFQNEDWHKINDTLKEKLKLEFPAIRICTQEQFMEKVKFKVINIIMEVLNENLEELKLSPFSCRWWTKELTNLEKEQNRLSNKSYRLRKIPNHLIHTKFKAVVNKFKELIIDVNSTALTG